MKNPFNFAKAAFLFYLLIFFVGFSFAQESVDYKILCVPDNFSQGEFSPFGGYEIFGKKPEIFKDFSNFTLERINYGENTQQLKLVGAVFINESDIKSTIYQINEILISQKELIFTTETIENTNYQFSGKFLVKGSLTKFNNKNEPVIQGTLSKFKDGKLLATENFKFSFKIWKAKYYLPKN